MFGDFANVSVSALCNAAVLLSGSLIPIERAPVGLLKSTPDVRAQSSSAKGQFRPAELTQACKSYCCIVSGPTFSE